MRHYAGFSQIGSHMAISYMSANCDPMVYPLIFPCGEPGWHNELDHVEAYKTPKHNKVTM